MSEYIFEVKDEKNAIPKTIEFYLVKSSLGTVEVHAVCDGRHQILATFWPDGKISRSLNARFPSLEFHFCIADE